jgi:hypothetical protein
VANESNKTAFVEFETMLRRHLRSGAAPVTACAGFDLDAASAYLEGALGGSHRASYESHLAGCALCRRHLIELARLAQAAPSFEARPAAAPDRIPAWDRWKEAVAGWFDLSTWNLKWQVAGATGVAFAILIAALGVQFLRRGPNQATGALSVANAPALTAAEPSPQTFPSPTLASEPSTLSDAVPVTPDLIANRRESSTIPLPSVGPVGGGAPNVHVEVSSASLAVNSSQPSEAPVVAKPGGVEQRQSPLSQPRTRSFDLSRAGESVLDRISRDESKGRAEEIAKGPGITPPRYQPVLVGGKSETFAEPQPSETSPSKLNLGYLSEPFVEMMRRISRSPRKLSFNSESEGKTKPEAKPDKQEAADDDTIKPMQKMIRDKIFCFEKCKGPDLEKIRGMWIDREYDFEKQKWNIFSLKSGSEEYKQVLAAEPLLKEFFDHRPILIVWKNRIYKVLK